VREAFLDSSVIWAFVGPVRFEPHHAESVTLFDRTDVRRYTSRTVESEVRNSERQRDRLYASLITHLREGRRPEEFPTGDLGRHLVHRARGLVRMIRKAEADTEYFRRLTQLEAARLREAFRRIEKPLVDSGKDVYFRDLLISRLGLSQKDASVVADFLLWSPGRTALSMVTLDNGMLRSVRQALDPLLEDRLGSEGFARSGAFMTLTEMLKTLPV